MGFEKVYKFSVEHRIKLSIARLGKEPWNKGISTDQNQHLKTGEDKVCLICGEIFYVPLNKIKRGRRFCSTKCGYIGRDTKGTFEKGHPIIGGAHSMPHTEEGRRNIGKSNKGKLTGHKNPNWKGGIGTLRHTEMGRSEYSQWRDKVFNRDNHTCQHCNKIGNYLHADHIIGWSENQDSRYDVTNGITLCYKCHYKKTFPNKIFDESNAFKWGVPMKYRKEVSFG